MFRAASFLPLLGLLTFFLPAVSFTRGVSDAAGEQMIQAEMTNLEPEDEPVSVPD